jgi:Flp pilus assembly pilin Flp
MFNFIKNFRNDEDGAVTVDWVVLTAAVVGLAVAAYATISENAQSLIDQAAVVVEAEETKITTP